VNYLGIGVYIYNNCGVWINTGNGENALSNCMLILWQLPRHLSDSIAKILWRE